MAFKRIPTDVTSVKANLNGKAGLAFAEFLDSLDWDKSAIFYEEERSETRSRTGYRVVHFTDRVEEKWHDAWGQTWFGLGASIS